MKKQDNFFETHFNHIVLGILIASFALYVLLDNTCIKQRQQRQEKQKNEQINNLNAQIQHRFQSVDSLRNGVNIQVADSLARHPEYKFIIDNQVLTDSLRAANQKMLMCAYNAASQQTIFEIVRPNETVFTKFAHIPTVKNIKWQYYANKQKIRDFDTRKQNMQHTPQLVRTHFDSIATAKIHQLQLELDSLLNQKNQILKSR